MRRTSIIAALTICWAALPAVAQSDWTKTYPISGKANVALETSDANLQVDSCGDCREVRVRVIWNEHKPEHYRLEESANGDTVRFSLKERPGVHMGFGEMHRRPLQVVVETPAELTFDAHTSDGHVSLANLRGDLSLQSGDGSVDIDHVEGNLHLHSGDGQVKVGNSSGTLDARVSDGSLTVDGVFHAFAVHSSDGNLSVTLREGSELTAASHIETSDGQVALQLPHNFAADLDVHTSDGQVNSTVPIALEHYESGKNDIHGKLNGGTIPLTIRTTDGSVSIQSL